MKSPTLVLRYPGGKTRAVPQLLERLPPDTGRLVSPFLGGGSFEMACEARGIEVVAGDLFEPLAQFWQQVLADVDAVVDRAEARFPFSRDKFRHLLRMYPGIDDAVERAAAFFLLNRCSFSGLTLNGVGVSMWHLKLLPKYARRLREFRAPGMTVAHADFEATIARATASDVIYCDPPYMLGADGNNIYSIHGGFDHFRLLRSLQSTPCRWLLSYNDCAGVRDLYSDYQIDRPSWSYGMSRTKGMASREVLVSNL